jgi:hypothetical protein
VKKEAKESSNKGKENKQPEKAEDGEKSGRSIEIL